MISRTLSLLDLMLFVGTSISGKSLNAQIINGDGTYKKLY